MEHYERLDDDTQFGVFASVARFRDLRDNQEVVAKRVRLDEENGISCSALREISILRTLNHENIVRFKECVQQGTEKSPLYSYLYIVLEALPMDLKMAMYKRIEPFNAQQVKSFLYQLCNAVAFCHAHGVMHRNLKPTHLLVTSDGRLKLAGFGLARSIYPTIRSLTQEVYTLWYRPPEILLGSPTYSFAADMWSIGSILVEMIKNRPLFQGECEIHQLYKIFRQLGTPSEERWSGVTTLPHWNTAFPRWKNALPFCHHVETTLRWTGVHLLSKFLMYDPKERITAKDSLRHTYFDDLDKTTLAT